MSRYETPPYTVDLAEGHLEVRAYAPHLVADVTVSGPQDDALGDGFSILADFIFGNNKGRQSVAMTAPVTQQAAPEPIAMTAPVTQQAVAEGSWTVRFVMPSTYTMDTLPTPNDARVKIHQEPARRFAAIRFSGFWSEAHYAERRAELETFMAAKNLKAAGTPPVSAYYNPPFTLPFLRRNEVLIELAR
jgi:hypothetical protein